MLTGTRCARGAQVDLQPLGFPYMGYRYPGALSFGDKADEVPRGHYRVLHEVDRSRASGADYDPQDPAHRVEEYSVSFRGTEALGV